MDEDLVTLRQALHRIPEASGQEEKTAGMVADWLAGCDHHGMVRDLGGHGVAVFFDGTSTGETLLFRADLDGVPVTEMTGLPYASVHKGLSHACGHDGHTAILCGLARELSKSPPKRGRVVLLFQPAEETGAGADAVIKDPRFQGIIPDRVFALHNLPGRPLGQVCVPDRLFACASLGMDIHLSGTPSHAAWPEHGNSPMPIVQALLADEGLLSREQGEPFFMSTVTHLQVGGPGFGVSPGEARVQLTLRGEADAYLHYRMSRIKEALEEKSGLSGLGCEVMVTNEFPGTPVDREMAEMVMEAATDAGLDVTTLSEPMRWSEDFGWFTHRYPGVMVGLGCGEGPQLHNADYNFPDALLGPGIALFSAIIRTCQRSMTP
ncbi:amidohydrolase [Desulfoluna butyratoxydans]|uniref:Amidohydrolase n=1 Tax=Desulfoluna butyratoxydans TaxID=231438 RepID=A0A4U8YTQ8_9BACT|nr:amidohydrolase [Desulfoluna butyratoxydans]VFQ46759.1 amidohydrolase [Desulfoluna butyratoxydans]